MSNLLGGATMMSYLIAALFFLRFWKNTGDRLHGMFSLAFCLMAWVRPMLVLGRVASEHYHYFYLLRLLAYALILYAIVDKNRAG